MTVTTDQRSEEAKAYRHLYGSPVWTAMSRAQRQAEPLCRMCMAEGRVTAGEVADHVIPHKGDEVMFWTGELQTLCAPCHNGPKQLIEKRGYDTRVSALTGWPEDPKHPANRGFVSRSPTALPARQGDTQSELEL